MRIQRAIAALFLFGSLAACGDGDTDEADTTGSLTEDQLDQALLQPGSVVDGWTVRELSEWNTEPSMRWAEPSSCAALAILPLDDIEPTSWGSVDLHREVPGSFTGDRVDFDVMSFGGDGAARSFQAFEEAVTRCAGGFTLELPANTIHVDGVSFGPAPNWGDESATAILTAPEVMDGTGNCAGSITVIRQGNELLWRDSGFHCEEFAAEKDGLVLRKAPPLPRGPVDEQLTRLGQARSS